MARRHVQQRRACARSARSAGDTLVGAGRCGDFGRAAPDAPFVAPSVAPSVAHDAPSVALAAPPPPAARPPTAAPPPTAAEATALVATPHDDSGSGKHEPAASGGSRDAAGASGDAHEPYGDGAGKDQAGAPAALVAEAENVDFIQQTRQKGTGARAGKGLMQCR